MKNLNVIYIIADQMRWDVLSCNGAGFMKTPNFERLASRGVNFTSAYSGNPVCVPARGIMATGCYSHNCMSKDAGNQNGGTIEREHIAHFLRENGYSTYGIGKAHYQPYKDNPGFDVFEVAEEGRIEFYKRNGVIADDSVKEDYLEYLRNKGLYGMQRAHGIGNNDMRAGRSPLKEEDYVDTWSTSRSLELLEKHLKSNLSKPFYLQLGWVKPHAPYDPPAPWDQMYDPLGIPEPHGSAADLKYMNPSAIIYRRNYLVDQMSEAGIQYSRAHYFGLVSYLDGQLGRVLDFVEKNNLQNETFIVFTSDHGDNLGDHGIFFKTVLAEGSAHIPLLMSLPGRLNPQQCDTPVNQEDIVPTIYELCKIKSMDEYDGLSMVEMLDGKVAKNRPFAISQYGSGEGLTLMIRQDNFKYCFARYESTEELYDLSKDPYEMNNLANDSNMAEKLEAMRICANLWCIENGHEPILDQHGNMVYSKFIAGEHLVEPSKVMGIRPW